MEKELNFVTRVRAKHTTDMEVVLTKHTKTLTRKHRYSNDNGFRLGVSLSKEAWSKLGRPTYLTVAIDATDDHTRVYFKPVDGSVGFAVHGDGAEKSRVNRLHFDVPRIAEKDIESVVGDYNFQFSKSYGLWYIEKRSLQFVQKG